MPGSKSVSGDSLDLGGDFSAWQPSALQQFWRVPFRDYSGGFHEDQEAPAAIKAARTILQMSIDLQSSPMGLIGMRIDVCLHQTRDVHHMYIAYLLSVLGCQLTSLDYQPEAENVHRRALCIAIRALGTGHYQLACAMDWLAYTLMRQGNYKESVLLCYSSMHITVAHVGTWHLDTANCYSNLGSVLHTMGLKDFATKLRAAGRTIFSLMGSPTMVQSWQDFYGAMGMISVHRSIIQPRDCSSSSSSCVSLESGVTKNVDGIIYDLLKDIEQEVDPSQCVLVEAIDTKCEDVQSREPPCPVHELKKAIGCSYSAPDDQPNALQDTEDGLEGFGASDSVTINSLTGIPVPTGLKDEISPGSVGNVRSEQDFTIGVGRSSASISGIEQV